MKARQVLIQGFFTELMHVLVGSTFGTLRLSAAAPTALIQIDHAGRSLLSC